MPCTRCGGPHSTEDCPLGRYKPKKKYAELELAGTIRDLQARKDLQLVTDSQDVKKIIQDLNIDPKEDFGGFFIKIEGGEYKEAYGFTGIVPELHKNIYYVRPAEYSSPQVEELSLTEEKVFENVHAIDFYPEDKFADIYIRGFRTRLKNVIAVKWIPAISPRNREENLPVTLVMADTLKTDIQFKPEVKCRYEPWAMELVIIWG